MTNEKHIGYAKIPYKSGITFHDVYDIGLPNGMVLHRFLNNSAKDCSAIYIDNIKVESCERDREPNMIGRIKEQLKDNPHCFDYLRQEA